ncbi:MAG: hypothetical protein K9G48_11830 [Reyranella sp.]|nr:hypothetical protein [Reyranella sp.]
MSSSVPSGSSAIDATFIVGTDLVEFDRHDLPIYATPTSRWADAGLDASSHGAPLDRLFGEPGEIHVGEIHVAGTFSSGQHAATATVLADDPLVVLAGLSDGLVVHAAPSGEPGMAAHFDAGIGSAAGVHLHDGSSWDLSGNDWGFDYTT